MLPILLGTGAAVGLFAAYTASRPSHFKYTRTKVIAAPPSAIFPLIENFREWVRWSPWEKMDGAMQKTYSGAEKGVGAEYAWKGDKNVGEGSMNITHVDENARVQLDLHFIKPFPAHNTTVFTLEPQGEGTLVSWTMEGDNSFLFKAVGVFMNMEKMIGKDFEKGLDALDSAVRGS